MEQKPKRTGGRPRGEFVSFEEAREWVSRLKLKNYKEWLKYAKRRVPRGKRKGLKYKPKIIPANPQCYYKDEWISDAHFLGHVPYMSYEDAKRFATNMQFRNVVEWHDWHVSAKPENIPRDPAVFYKEWESWGVFLGTGNVSSSVQHKNYRPYLEALKYVHTLNLSSEMEYREWHKTHNITDLPVLPQATYKDWEGWPKFLGKDITSKVEGHTVDVSVLVITQHQGFPSNVYEIRIDRGGKSSVLSKQKENQFRIIKIYKNEADKQVQIQRLISSCGSPWWEGNNMFLIQNIHQLLFDLDNLLLWA